MGLGAGIGGFAAAGRAAQGQGLLEGGQGFVQTPLGLGGVADPGQGAGATAASPGAWGLPQQAFSPSRPSAPEPETEALDAADVEDAGQQQNVAPQPAPRAPEPTRPPHIEEPPADDDDLDLPAGW